MWSVKGSEVPEDAALLNVQLSAQSTGVCVCVCVCVFVSRCSKRENKLV